jgi:hypothetical protein
MHLWSVGGWKEGPALGNSAGGGVFSADGLLAVQNVPGVVRLVRPSTGKEIARITVPETIPLIPIRFTRDGRRLVCQGDENGALYVFDLGLIRTQLAAMGLDWDAPPCPTESNSAPAPVAVRIVGTDLLAEFASGRTAEPGAKPVASQSVAEPVVAKPETAPTAEKPGRPPEPAGAK